MNQVASDQIVIPVIYQMCVYTRMESITKERSGMMVVIMNVTVRMLRLAAISVNQSKIL